MHEEAEEALLEGASLHSDSSLPFFEPPLPFRSRSRPNGRRLLVKYLPFLLLLSLCFNVYLFLDYSDLFPSGRRKEILFRATPCRNTSCASTNYHQTSPNSKSVHNLLDFLPSSKQLNQTESFALGESESNIAGQFWEKWKALQESEDLSKYKGVTICDSVTMPHPLDVQFNNPDWQFFQRNPEVPGNSFPPMYLYNAYYERRTRAPLVKILTANSNDKLMKKKKWWCLLWFPKVKAPILVPVTEYYTLMATKTGLYHNSILSCSIPNQLESKIPGAVSLQESGECAKIETKPKNLLRVIFNQRNPINGKNKMRIAVTTPAFRFGTYDFSARLVEWLEALKVMGVDKVFLYVYGAPLNMIKVLDHYQKQGFVSWRYITLPGHQPAIKSLYNLWAFKLSELFWPEQLIELNDALYRTMYQYDYLMITDADEMVMPNKVDTWPALIRRIESKMSHYKLSTMGYYCFQHSHVCQVYEEEAYEGEPIPEYMYMMRHTYRGTPLSQGSNQKCMHPTHSVSVVHNHSPIACLDKKTGKDTFCKGVYASLDEAVLMHYRRNQSDPGYTWRNYRCPIHDQRMWRYFGQMTEAVKGELEDIFVK